MYLVLLTLKKLQEQFNISDGIDGSATSYTITFSDSSFGSMCFIKIIQAMDCKAKLCEYLFDVLSSQCSSSNGITVNVLASNIFGDGPVSNAVSIQGIPTQ